MKPASARHRTDTTSKALTAEAERLGVQTAPLGGVIDALWWLGSVIRAVDYKSPGGQLTEAQSKLVARGCPVVFCSRVDDVAVIVAGMRREALR